MGLPRPPAVLAACWVAGMLACSLNADSHAFVPGWRWQAAEGREFSTTLTRFWEAIGPASARAETASQSAAYAAPSFTRIIISLPADISFEGTGVPGDRISLHLDGSRTAETDVDADGQWRIDLADPLPPGDHAATAFATAPNATHTRISEEIRIAIPQPAAPVYVPPQVEVDPDPGPPNAATRRRAAELAREANSYFNELSVGKKAEPAGSRSDDSKSSAEAAAGDSKVVAGAEASRSDHAPSGIAGWLARARHDYNKVLVAGLSDPRRRGAGGIEPENGPAVIPPLPARPQSVGRDDPGYIEIAMNWLQQASRDYQDQLVSQLKLRGADKQAPYQDATPNESKTNVAAASPARQSEEPAEHTTHIVEAEREAEEQRLAEAAAAREEQERAAAAQRQEAERRAADERRRAIKQEAERQRHAQRAEVARNAHALETLLAERDKLAAPAPDPAGQSQKPVQPEPPTAQKAEADGSRTQIAATIPPPARIAVHERAHATPAASNTPVANPDLRERGRRLPPLPETRGETSSPVPLPITKPDLPHRPARQEVEVKVSQHDAGSVTASEARERSDRHRWCSNPRAGRTIRPPGTYVVAYGDTLWDIAERHYDAGYLYRRIRRANRRKIARSRWIYPCQRLWLPRIRSRRR